MSQPRSSYHPPPSQTYLLPPSPSSSTYSMAMDPLHPIHTEGNHHHSSTAPKPLSQRPFINKITTPTKPPISPPSSSTTSTTARRFTLVKHPPPPPAPQTRYMTMLLSLDAITRLHNILASFFTYILLLGFVLLPGSFTPAPPSPTPSKPTTTTPPPPSSPTTPEKVFIALGFHCIIVGVLGVVWLGIRWRRNYVWVINKIYIPVVLNGVVGIVGTVVGVVMAEGGFWSVTARAGLGLEIAVVVVAGGLFGWYNFGLLRRLKEEHDGARGKGGGFWEKSGKVPGSLV
ncbi:hypothetical protein B0T16DRAFT_462483 [Cercophora newfieldiana]|uniref:Uncharacterized protein n=1 Tax=Cercophora newfieldiana TaxID=92897 RepID=A0AA39XTD1_9PEZI|nr:hypothetical protein B0T16DRAFT_462483 [Cercophora newfieldiana]